MPLVLKMRLDLHIHTEHSFDSKIDIKSLLLSAREKGLDAIAICDHDTISAIGLARKFSGGITIIPGMEISSQEGPHIIGLFLKDEIISRNLLDIIDEIHNQDGLVLLPHPFRPRCGFIHGMEKDHTFAGEEIATTMAKIDLIEVVSFGSSIEELSDTDRFLKFYPNIPQVAASNAHSLHEVGKAYVEFGDIKVGTLEEIREALLHASRTLRYEVYDAVVGWENRVSAQPGMGNRLLSKTKRAISSPLKKSIKAIYRKSAEMAGRAKEKKIHPV